MNNILGWYDWFGKEHKQVKESRDIGIRDFIRGYEKSDMG